jgi:hypothetical protein
VRDVCESVAEAVPLDHIVYVTVFVSWLEGDAECEEDADEELVSLGIDEIEAMLDTVSSFVRVAR